jgi:hypothetical protein
MQHTRTDGNQGEIVRALKAFGASVHDTSQVGRGFPDLVVGFRGRTWLMEVKMHKGVLTPEQVIWHAEWTGQVAIVRTSADALAVIGVLPGPF